MTKPGAFSVTTRQIILARAGGYCERRGCTAPASNIHHRRARGMGGDRRPETSSASNGVALCGSGTQGCHGWVEAHPNEARELGLRVHRNHDPAEIPVYLRRGWVLLTDDGRAEPTQAPTRQELS